MIRANGVCTVVAIVLTAVVMSACREKDQTPAIIAAFNHYQTAAIAKDGKKAVEAVSQRTIDYYDKALDRALHAGIEELNAVPVADRMLAITLRHELDTERAQAMEGAAVLAWCVEMGWMVQEQEKDSKLENIRVKGDEATADYSVPGYPAAFPRVFRKEGKTWKNDLVPTFLASVNELMANAQAEAVDQQNELIYVGLSLRTKKPLSREIWTPPFPRPTDAPKPPV